MKKPVLFIIAVFLLGNVFAQSENIKIYPFKKAIITYKLSGDYEGMRTLYIDDFGAKLADYWEGSFEKRQPGPNTRVPFKFHDIFIGKLKYQINETDYSAMITTNPYYFYAKDAANSKTAMETILMSEHFEKTDRIEQVGDDKCTVWHQRISFGASADNYIWLNDRNIVCKYEFSFLMQLQYPYAFGVATIDKIDFDSEIPNSIFSDFPDYIFYQYAQSSDQQGNSFDDQVFSSDEEKQKFEEKFKTKAFVPSRDINEDTYQKNVQAFSDLYIGSMVDPGFDDGNGFINSQFQIKESTDSTKEETMLIDIRNRKNLERVYLDDYKRGFNDFTTKVYEKIEIDGKKGIYISGLKEGEPLSAIILNDKDKYCIKFEVYGTYNQDEMVKMLKQTKILDL